LRVVDLFLSSFDSSFATSYDARAFPSRGSMKYGSPSAAEIDEIRTWLISNVVNDERVGRVEIRAGTTRIVFTNHTVLEVVGSIRVELP
jgi:hypothetical protein